MAVRGERLSLVEIRDPDPVEEPSHRFVVEETDSHQRLVRIAIYEPDELAHAADDFDRRWLHLYEGESGETLAAFARWASAHLHEDVESAATLLTDDAAFVDHRPMGYPTLDRNGILASIGGVLGEVHGIEVTSESPYSMTVELSGRRRSGWCRRLVSCSSRCSAWGSSESATDSSPTSNSFPKTTNRPLSPDSTNWPRDGAT